MPSTIADNLIRDQYKLVLIGADVDVTFQFAPKVTSDQREIDWLEIIAFSTEEIAEFKFAKARSFNLEWTYIVGHDRAFGVNTVSQICGNIRQYFFSGIKNLSNRALISIVLARHGDTKPMTARFVDLSFKHSSAQILENGQVFPLRTDITATIKLWSQGADSDGKDVKQKVDGLRKAPFGLWV